MVSPSIRPQLIFGKLLLYKRSFSRYGWLYICFDFVKIWNDLMVSLCCLLKKFLKNFWEFVPDGSFGFKRSKEWCYQFSYKMLFLVISSLGFGIFGTPKWHAYFLKWPLGAKMPQSSLNWRKCLPRPNFPFHPKWQAQIIFLHFSKYSCNPYFIFKCLSV